MDSSALETLLEERKIERLMVAYASAIDRRDWAGLDEVLAPDATAHYESLGRFDGRGAILAMLRDFLDRCGPTQHLVGNLRVAVEGRHATASCAIHAIHVGLGAYSDRLLTVWGEYRDRLELRPEGWRITHKELALVHVAGDIGVSGGK